MSKYQSICQRFFIILISIAVYSCQGAGGAGLDETEAATSAMTAKKRIYNCSACSMSFPRKDHLDRHMRVHTGERPYICSECGSAFSQKCALTKHMRTHTGERPYRCPECSSAFKEKSHLDRHMRMHSDERPYICTECGRRFSLKSSLTRHKCLPRRFSCDTCGDTFALKHYLNEHLRTDFRCTAAAALLELGEREGCIHE